MTELKPCPFCGGKATFYKNGSYYNVECDRCGVRTKLCGSLVSSNEQKKERAAQIWNRRVNNG